MEGEKFLQLATPAPLLLNPLPRINDRPLRRSPRDALAEGENLGIASPRAGAAFAGLKQASTQPQCQSRCRYLLGLCRGCGGASSGAPRAPQRGVSELCSSLPRSAARSHPPC